MYIYENIYCMCVYMYILLGSDDEDQMYFVTEGIYLSFSLDLLFIYLFFGVFHSYLVI